MQDCTDSLPKDIEWRGISGGSPEALRKVIALRSISMPMKNTCMVMSRTRGKNEQKIPASFKFLVSPAMSQGANSCQKKKKGIFLALAVERTGPATAQV